MVKKPEDAYKSLIKGNFQNELKILMKISYGNVVRLKGVCLEPIVPSLVYEYIPNGALFQHIHQNVSTVLKSWEDRFRIAAETTLALDFMHSCIVPPIVHGNIKLANILLDQKYSAKVSDFGTSVFISPEHRHIVATKKQDSCYIDLEYLISGMLLLTIQSDVYNFGVVLVELLTRKKLFVNESGESINMIHRCISSVKDNKLCNIINFEGACEYDMERVEWVAQIALKCLDQSGANRPAIKKVALQLASIILGSTIDKNDEETGYELDTEQLFPLETAITDEASPHGTSRCLF